MFCERCRTGKAKIFPQRGLFELDRSVFGISSSRDLYFVIRNMSYFLKITAGFIKILMPVIYGAVIAYLVNPLCKRFYRLLCRTGKDKELSDRTKKIFYSLVLFWDLSAVF